MTHPCARYDQAGIVLEHKHDIWRNDDTCSYCGGLKPLKALRLVAQCQEIIQPIDPVGPTYLGHMRRKVYLQHFSHDEELLFWRMLKTNSPTERLSMLIEHSLLQPKVTNGKSVIQARASRGRAHHKPSRVS